MRSLRRDVKDGDRFSGASRKNHSSGLCNVARTMRAVDGESHVLSFFQTVGHDGEPFDGSPGGTSLRCAETQALDYAPRPLPVEIHGVEHHDATFAPNPDRGKNAPMPKRADRDFARIANLHSVLHPDHFHSQRGANQPHHPIHGGGNDGNLHSPPTRKFRRARVELMMTCLRIVRDGRFRIVWHCGIV